MIQGLGLFWRRELTLWKRPFDGAGRLLGRQVKGPHRPIVDFRFQAGVYILHDGFRVIYVGQTGANRGRLFGRLRGHTKDSLAERWDRFSWFGLHSPIEGADGLWGVANENAQPVGAQERFITLNHLEGILIAVAEPPLNRRGPNWGSDVTQYVQLRPIEDAPEEDDE